ncbi:MAG: DUF4230 domain-containing protein [Bacteroidales bacterium]|nr:DUF4230 domain-containing protein [Bacteroidales bacterium]
MRKPALHIPLRYLLPLTLLLAVILVLLLFPPRRRPSRGLQADSTPTLVQEVRSLGELASAGYYEELVLTDRDDTYLGELKRASGLNRLIGNSDFVLICKGRVRAGFDLTKIEGSDFRVAGDTLHLVLPPVEILDVVINPADYEVFAGHRTHEETAGIILQAKQRLRADAIQAGILQQAERSAESHLRRLFGAMGYREIRLVFRKELALPSGG